MNIKKTALAAALTMALGFPVNAPAIVFYSTFEGLFTLTDQNGVSIINSDGIGQPPWFGRRTPIFGTLVFDADAGTGTGEILPFSFFGQGDMVSSNVTIKFIGNGFGGYGNLSLANMSFDWNNNAGIPASVVWDNTGLIGAGFDGYDVGEIVTGRGALPATDYLIFGLGGKTGTYILPIGPAPIVTTDWDTRTIGSPCDLGCHPSGTLPLVADDIGGSPMPGGPFQGFSANFDITKLRFTTSPPIPEFVEIDIPGGGTQECDAIGGNEVSMDAQLTLLENDVVATVSWSLDGVPVASGESVVVSVPLGSHTVEVNVTTILGSTLSESAAITVQDTVAPVIDAAFLHPRTGAEITEIRQKGKADIAFNANDVCDESPVSSAMAGLPVFDGGRIKTRPSKAGSSSSGQSSSVKLSIQGNVDNIEVIVTSEDASGNTSNRKISLEITE